jgi:hypothetical protein
MKAFTSRARKLFIISIATVCLVVGAITAPMPIPTGVPLIALGIVLLVGVSATARRFVRRGRARWHKVDHAIVWIEDRAHRNMSTMLRRTRPLARKLEAKRLARAREAALLAAHPDVNGNG